MPGMLFATVTEIRTEMNAVEPDTFVADLDHASAETIARRAALAELASTSPHRRVYD